MILRLSVALQVNAIESTKIENEQPPKQPPGTALVVVQLGLILDGLIILEIAQTFWI